MKPVAGESAVETLSSASGEQSAAAAPTAAFRYYWLSRSRFVPLVEAPGPRSTS